MQPGGDNVTGCAVSAPRGSEPALHSAGSVPARPCARHVLPTHVEAGAATAPGHRDLLCVPRQPSTQMEAGTQPWPG